MPGFYEDYCFHRTGRNYREVLKHLGLWLVKKRPPPRIHSPPAELYADYSSTELTEVFDSQIPPWDDDYSEPDYAFEAYI